MILDLGHEESRDPTRTGVKAAWLARARHAGLPVLPGFIVESAASRRHMAIGGAALSDRGSGGARLAVAGEPIDFADAAITAGRKLGGLLVARSSTMLEGGGEWSGAFASYLELTPQDLPKAVVGCWASAFSVDALARQNALGIEPGSFGMGVLIQPELEPVAGGVATVSAGGSVEVHGVAGSPAPLLTGWSEALPMELLDELIGSAALDELSDALGSAFELLGANHCEWAFDGAVWILQLGIDDSPAVDERIDVGEDVHPAWLDVVRALAIARGPLGEELILPWALGGLPGPMLPEDGHTGATREDAERYSADLITEVWGMDVAQARRRAEECLAQLHGPDPGAALATIGGLSTADPARAARLLAHIEALEDHDVDRVGRGRWEPLIASVVLSAGDRRTGVPAAPGIGGGRSAQIPRPETAAGFVPRGVVVTGHPLPFVAPLLWDAAGLVTHRGSPAAHLFRSARALGVPAVCGVDLQADRGQVLAVDGDGGLVASVPL